MKFVRTGILLACHMVINTAYSAFPEYAIAADSKAYCQYIRDKNKMKSILLRSPDAIARLDNGLNYNNFQRIAITGLSKDLSDLSKAKYVDDLIERECTYYTLNQEAKLQVQFALASVKAASLDYKLQQIQKARSKLNNLLESVKHRIDNQNDTLINYYNLDSSLIKLADSEREIYIELAGQHIPKMTHPNLKKLLQKLTIAQEQRRKTLNTLEKQNNWSIRVEAGTQQDLSNMSNQNVQPYVALLLRYNLGDLYTSTKQNQSIRDYMQWQRQQVLGSLAELSELIRAISLLKKAEEDRLAFLQKNYKKHYDLTQKLHASNSVKAARFKRAIEVDKIMMEIEINYISHSIKLLNSLV